MDRIVESLKKGSKKAFCELYDSLFAPLCAFGNKYLTNTLLIEDFVEEIKNDSKNRFLVYGPGGSGKSYILIRIAQSFGEVDGYFPPSKAWIYS